MTVTFVIAQSNFTAGYVEGNIAKIKSLYDVAVAANADMVIFPEMAITGYPTEDLVLSEHFQEVSMQATQALAAHTNAKTAMLVGGVWRDAGALYNTAFLMESGTMRRQFKHQLPNYGVFDEKRIFTPGNMPEPMVWRGMNLGILLCEDAWVSDVARHLKRRGAELLISVHASPFEVDKLQTRQQVMSARVKETELPLIYVNAIGGQDELVFDGGSFALSAQSEVVTQMSFFAEDVAIVLCTKEARGWVLEKKTVMPAQPTRMEMIYKAMVLGLRDFVNKNGFAGIVLGLSGGIDSAISAAIAADAVGSERVRLVMLPSSVTSQESVEDARQCAALLDIVPEEISITPGIEAFERMMSACKLQPHFDVATQNNQTRLRCSVLTAIAAQNGLLLLNTSNKSECAVGYGNLYGDMAGHYSVLKDLYKTTVYEVAKWRNSIGKVIPERVITKAPSAELKPGQKDEDTLPPYAVLDAILERLIEKRQSGEEIIAAGYVREVVEQVANMVRVAQYKRHQMPPGVKITSLAFGRDWRFPITSGWLF